MFWDFRVWRARRDRANLTSANVTMNQPYRFLWKIARVRTAVNDLFMWSQRLPEVLSSLWNGPSSKKNAIVIEACRRWSNQ